MDSGKTEYPRMQMLWKKELQRSTDRERATSHECEIVSDTIFKPGLLFQFVRKQNKQDVHGPSQKLCVQGDDRSAEPHQHKH
jgi:hypothetical protein